MLPNAERTLYAAGNPHVYEPVPAESAYAELDREHSRRLAELARLRGELFDARAELRLAKAQAFAACVGLGLVAVGGLLTVGILLLR